MRSVIIAALLALVAAPAALVFGHFVSGARESVWGGLAFGIIVAALIVVGLSDWVFPFIVRQPLVLRLVGGVVLGVGLCGLFWTLVFWWPKTAGPRVEVSLPKVFEVTRRESGTLVTAGGQKRVGHQTKLIFQNVTITNREPQPVSLTFRLLAAGHAGVAVTQDYDSAERHAGVPATDAVTGAAIFVGPVEIPATATRSGDLPFTVTDAWEEGMALAETIARDDHVSVDLEVTDHIANRSWLVSVRTR